MLLVGVICKAPNDLPIFFSNSLMASEVDSQLENEVLKEFPNI